jgi:hypothetical protein
MKIWFRVGVEREGPRPPQQRPASANAEVRCLRPERSIGVPLSHPRRISRGRFLQPGRASGTRLSAPCRNTQRAAPTTRKSLKNERVFAKWAPTSNRFWPKNRCCRKQRTKPRLTGARTHISDFGFLALSASTEHRSRTAEHATRNSEHLHPEGLPSWCTYATLARGDSHEWATSNASRVI